MHLAFFEHLQSNTQIWKRFYMWELSITTAWSVLFVGWVFLWKLYIKTLRATGHGILVKQKAAQHYCQNTFKRAVHRQNKAFYIQIFPLSKAISEEKKKSVVKATYFLHLMSWSTKKQLKHLLKGKDQKKHRTSGKWWFSWWSGQHWNCQECYSRTDHKYKRVWTGT